MIRKQAKLFIKGLKLIFAVCGGLILIGLLILVGQGLFGSKTKHTVTEKNAPTTKVNRHNLVVSSMIVKKVGDKYRYFFDIRNKGVEVFKGKVTITLVTGEEYRISRETFETGDSGIEPNIGKSVYFDANTGPPKVHGKSGYNKFEYQVQSSSGYETSGEDKITDKLEFY